MKGRNTVFKYSKPISLKLKEYTDGLSAFYAANFECDGKDAILYITCSKSAKITVNGDFAGYIEPKTDGYKIDGYELDISDFVSWGLNQIIIEVCGGGSDAFLVAEVWADGNVKCATGKNFIGFIDTERLFDSSILLNANHYEHYQKGGPCMLKANVDIREHQYIVIFKKHKSISDECVLVNNCKLNTINDINIVSEKKIFGFLEIGFNVSEKSEIIVETSTTKTFKNKSIYRFDILPGEYTVQSHSPSEIKYVRIKMPVGKANLEFLKINSYSA